MCKSFDDEHAGTRAGNQSHENGVLETWRLQNVQGRTSLTSEVLVP